jgi:hypothetical protein
MAGESTTPRPLEPLVGQVRHGVLDAELAALLTLLADGGLSLTLVGPDPAAAKAVATAILDASPGAADRNPVDLVGIGDGARAVLRAASLGAPFAATVEGSSLEDANARLRRSGDVAEDELSYLGCVVVLGDDGRVAAAHYVRPVALDAHGHVQRLGPAVLAARDATSGRLEHFAWGAMPELASRLGRSAAEVEDAVERHRSVIGHLAGLHG